jgi:dTDP-4-dehydrorhamnose reductase
MTDARAELRRVPRRWTSARRSRELANLINGKGAGELAFEAAQRGAKFVHFSTDYVFDGTLRRPLATERSRRTA